MSGQTGGWRSPDDREPPSDSAGDQALPPSGHQPLPPSGYHPPPPSGQQPPPPSGHQPPPPVDFQAPPGWGGPAAPSATAWGGAGWGTPRPAEPRPGVIPLRPLGLGELLDGGVALIRRYPRPALGFSAGVALLSTAANLLITLTALQPALRFDSTSLNTGDLSQLEGVLGGAAIGGVAASLISVLATLLLTGVMTAIVGRAVLGQPMTVADAWTEVRPALPRLLGIAFLTSLLVYGVIAGAAVAAALLALLAGPRTLLVGVPLVLASVVLAVFLYGRLSLAPAVALLERASVRTSLRRSSALVRRSWWRVIGILLLTVLIGSFVAQVVQAPFLLFGGLPSGFANLTDPSGVSTAVLVLSAVGGGIAQTVVAPFSSGVRALLYVDRRMRAEGLDVALAAAAAGSPTSATPAT